MIKRPSVLMFWTFFFITLMMILIVGSIVYYLRSDSMRDNGPLDKIKSGQFTNTFNFYFLSNPQIINRQFYGFSNASVTIVGYIDPTSAAGKYFIINYFPLLRSEFINTGSVKFYPKYYVSEEDITNKNDNFIYSTYIFCVNKINKNKFFDFYFDTFQISEKKYLNDLVVKHNISVNEIKKCLDNQSWNEIYEDAGEIRRFGMSGVSPRFYIGILGRDNKIIDGVPSYNTFKRIIRLQQFIIGK
ncbi:MAG: thioredoxin domain-containing protein [Candidatus Woesearchaeota archaeon]